MHQYNNLKMQVAKFILRNSVRKHLDEINVSETIGDIKEMRMNGISSENASSSRSHLLIQIWNTHSFLNILDMACSEKASKSICRNKKRNA